MYWVLKSSLEHGRVWRTRTSDLLGSGFYSSQ